MGVLQSVARRHPGSTADVLLRPELTAKNRVGLLLQAMLSFLANAKA